MNLLTVGAGRLVATLLTIAVTAGCGASADAAIGPIVPNVVGEALDVAKEALQAAEFANLSQDLLGNRSQVVDSNWMVCTQDPGPVPAEEGTTVTLGVVKDSETCPGEAATTTAAPTTSVVPTTAPELTITTTASPEPRPQPKPQPKPADPPADNDDSGSGGRSNAGAVHPGAFCDPPGTGLSPKGKPMVCAPASDGKNRWRSA